MRETVRKFKETVEIRSSIFNRFKAHKYFPMTVLFAVFLISACFHVWQRVRVINLVKETAQLKAENASLLDDKKKLYSDIAALSSTSRIETYAVDTLGLRMVDANNLLTLIKENETPPPPDEFELMYTAIKRVTDFLPVVEQTNANARGVEDLEIDSSNESRVGN